MLNNYGEIPCVEQLCEVLSAGKPLIIIIFRSGITGLEDLKAGCY